MAVSGKIDLHMHTSVSDGTDSPAEIIGLVKNAGIGLFSVTDHDSVKGSTGVKDNLKKGDPDFIFGVEFSCKDEEGQYHILGYGYDPESSYMQEIVEKGHGFRIKKLNARLDYLKTAYNFTFSDEDVEYLHSLINPGKPHVAKLMVKYGYASSISDGITDYINNFKIKDQYIRPEEAIQAVIKAKGIPVLAHPSYGRGDELFIGKAMEERLTKLIGYGLKGVEAFYSGFTPPLQNEILSLAEKYNLYVTAGSDYHGSTKLVELGDTNLSPDTEYPSGLKRFIKDVKIYRAGEKPDNKYDQGENDMLKTEKKIDNKLVTFTLEGRLDTITAPQLETEIKEAISGAESLVLDLKNLDYISSAGLRVILSAQKIMNVQGKMKIINVQPAVMEVFEVTGFLDILTIE